MNTLDLVQWGLAALGWTAAATMILLALLAQEHPATLAILWSRRLAPVVIGAIIALFAIGRVVGDVAVLKTYVLGLVAWGGVGVPIASAVHLWRTRGLWRGEFDQGGKDRQQLGLTTPTDDASGDGETR